MKTIKPIKIGDCLRWNTGSDPSNLHRCHSCGIGPCILTDYVLSGRGRRRKKRKVPQVPGDGYPRYRTDSNTVQVPIQTDADHQVSHSFWIDSDFRAMWERSRSPSGNVDVLNYRHWHYRDDSPLYRDLDSGWHTLINYVAHGIFSHCFALFGPYESSVWGEALYNMEPIIPAAQARQRALKAMRPSLTTGFSLLNFIIELKDFKSFFDGSMLKDLSAWLPSNKKGQSLVGHTLNELANLAALGQLTWSFAIKPLLSDIEKIVKILSSFEERTRRFIDNSTALSMRRHYGVDVHESELLSEAGRFSVELPYASSSALCALRLEPQARPVSVTGSNHWRYQATLDFDYYVQKLVEMNSQLAGLLQQLGVKPDASIIWNALPFSFVVDWFFRVGDWLEANYSVDVMSATVNVHDWVESYRLRYSVDILSLDLAPGATSIAPLPLPAVAAGEVYLRRSVRPPDLESWGALDVDQGIVGERAVLSAALLKRLFN